MISLAASSRCSCDRDPNFKSLTFFENFLKILNVFLEGDQFYFWGDNVYLGEIRFTFGDARRFKGFGTLLFVVGGVGVFENM